VLSPYGKHRDRLEARKNLVLSRMLELGFITQTEHDKAKSELVAFVPKNATGIKAPHFVFFIKDYLEEKYGAQAIEYGGLKVTTTIDAELQAKAEEYVKQGALENERDWNGKNAALVAIDPKTGQIITMVGSRDYFDKTIDGNFNIATAKRQPGSSFKPFIYATAFNKGFTPNTVLFDVPTEFQTTCDPYGNPLGGRSKSECYMPSNYDGKFRGPMTLRNALAQSINIPAIKLFYLAGLPDSLKTAEEMGITTLGDIGRYGLTLVIGGGEVSLLDITSAYGVFANSGVRNTYTGVLKVEDLKGNVLEEFRPEEREVLPKNTALTISDILSDNNARIPTFGANSPLNIPGHAVAVKTGTTNNNKDAWTIGYTPNLVVGVWAGNNDNTPMKKGGAALAGPIWNKFMADALSVLPPESFEAPDYSQDAYKKPILRGYWQGGETFVVDKISGKLATEYTPEEAREEKVITNVHTILYWINRNDIMGPPPANPASNPQFKNWETAVQNWWARNGGSFPVTTPSQKPTATDDIHTDSSRPQISILTPNAGVYYPAEQPIEVRTSASGIFPLTKMEIFINDIYLETIEPPFNFSFVPADLENLQEINELKIIGQDTAFNSGEALVKFKVK
jgi:membrane peptidoglycan carboxypeptidase